jgi:CRISPR-associated protein Cas5d
MRNSVEFKTYGRYALFSDPITKIGGEKGSYQIPTYEALKGILSSVYWKPTLVWIIDSVRVMRAIKTQTRSVKPIKMYGKGGSDLAIYTYLADVEYQVQAHFEWNLRRADLEQDRNEHKHHNIAKRMIEHGGRRDVFLGTRECQGYVEPCAFGEGAGYYDDNDWTQSFGLMFHGFDYPDESGTDQLVTRLWYPRMIKGIVEFPRPDDPRVVRRLVRTMTPNPPESAGLNEPGLIDLLEEEGA